MKQPGTCSACSDKGNMDKKNFYYLGIDFSDRYTVLSYVKQNMKEPEVVRQDEASEQERIPTLLAKHIGDENWYFGEDAKRLMQFADTVCVDGILRKAMAGEEIKVGAETYTGTELLAIYLGKLLGLTEGLQKNGSFDQLVVSVEKLDRQTMEAFWKALPALGIPKERFRLIDHKEAFCYFALNQNENLRPQEVFLFEYDKVTMQYLELRRNMRTKPQSVTILESTRFTIRQDRDEEFLKILQKAFENKMVASVYLVGSGFQGNWMKQSLSYLLKGRKAYMGNHLYSKGCCYGAMVLEQGTWPYLYMGENVMKFSLSIKTETEKGEAFYTLIEAGTNWYDAEGSCKVILAGSPEIDFWKHQPNIKLPAVESLELSGLPEREDRATRLAIHAKAISDHKVELTIRDEGFGDFYRSSDKVWAYTMSM